MKTEDENVLREHLRAIRMKGVDLYLEGKPASPDMIARRFFVCEDAIYMPDYVTDEQGRLTQVRYDRIKNR